MIYLYVDGFEQASACTCSSCGNLSVKCMHYCASQIYVWTPPKYTVQVCPPQRELCEVTFYM